MRVAFVDAYRDRWPVAAMCKAIGLAERTYYARKSRPASARQLADEVLKVDIARVFDANWRCYEPKNLAGVAPRRHRGGPLPWRGSWPTWASVGAARQEALHHNADLTAARPPDLVDRRFVADRPDELWLADIARNVGGLAVRQLHFGLLSRMIVGWQIATHLRADLVLDALEMAIFRRDVTAGLIHHSDAGCRTRRSATPIGSPRRASRRRSARWPTAMTTPWPRR